MAAAVPLCHVLILFQTWEPCLPALAQPHYTPHEGPSLSTHVQTWAGGVHWPDFVWNPEADSYWQELLRSWPNGSEWSGLWLGMNEGGWGSEEVLPDSRWAAAVPVGPALTGPLPGLPVTAGWECGAAEWHLTRAALVA